MTEPGRHYAAAVNRLCREAGAASVRVVAVPAQFPVGWDLADTAPNTWDVAKMRSLIDSAQPMTLETTADNSCADNGDTPHLRTYTLTEFLSLKLVPRELVLSPWLPTQGLAMVYAARGVGKTHFVLHCLYAIACGTDFLRFHAPKPRRTLYVDAEMPAALLQQRLAAIVVHADQEPAPADFRTFSADCARYAPDITTRAGQRQIEDLLDDADVLALDNLSALCRTGVENEAESWAPVQEWLLTLRRHNKSVLLVHHAGRNGFARGTSKREDVLDEVIALKHPADYGDSQGARFEVRFEKRRALFGRDAEPFEAALTTDPTGRAVWTMKPTRAPQQDQVAALVNDGLSQRAIAQQLKLSVGKVNRLAQALRSQGVADGE